MSILMSQLSALFWKNWILTKRRKLATIFCFLMTASLFIYWNTSLLGWVLLSDQELRELNAGSFLFTFAFISACCYVLMDDIVSRIMVEKTNKIREHFRFQGAGELPYLLSYVLYYSLIAVIISLFPMVTVLLIEKMPYEPLIIGILCLIASISLAYLHCAFFDDLKVSRFCILVVWLACSAPMFTYYLMRESSFSGDIQNFAANTAAIFQYLHPGSMVLYHFSPITVADNIDDFTDRLPLKLILIPLCHILIYLGLGMYLHQVVPSKHGSSKPWNFFLKTAIKSTPVRSSTVTVDPARFEPANTARPTGVVLENVVKHFDHGSIVAVNDISLNIYQGEVFALLGHNGAGKTTLLECAIGIQPVTQGRIIVNGYDVSDNSAEARNCVGVCPQYDAFYPNLKPIESLELYARLRGQSPAQAHSEAEMMLERLGLLKKMHAMPKDLSGGQKRKLSVGLAFAGGSKIVVLDEPSSGLDTESALELWTVIRNARSGRTIILTTHSMNEAEALGDRIGIMSAGTMQCLGSPIFLKSRLGSGYLMSLKFEEGSRTDPAHIQSLVSQFIPNAKVLPLQNGHDLSFQIPIEDVHLMSNLLLEIEAQKSNLFVQNYSLTPSRLEDVFLNVTRAHEENLFQGLQTQKPLPEFSVVPVSLGTQIQCALILFWHYFRTDISYFISLVFPIVFMIMGCCTSTSFFNFVSIWFLLFWTSSTACSILTHFTQSDVRLQLDIFGMKSYVYWSVIIICNLIQIGLPFGLIPICFILTGVELPYTSGVVAGFVFSIVGFMAFLGTIRTKQQAGFSHGIWYMIIAGNLLNASPTGRTAFLYYLGEAFQIHPICLFLYQRFNAELLTVFVLVPIFVAFGFLYLSFAIMLDYRRLHPNNGTKKPIIGLETGRVSDEDVIAESNRIKSGAKDILQIVDLAKVYGKTAAVRGISVGVLGGQSLAFLGINGSGKSSSIRCMLGISAPSCGCVKVAGIDVTKDESGARRHICYVPQHDDILIQTMTARQQLHFFAKLTGVPENVRSELVNNVLFNAGLDKAADRRCGTYSGGMKRKLCVCLAMMIKRSVVLLDEPSTGVDPASRRRFWAMFAQIQSDPNRCLLLTTHQLDEAEAVCDRISIMVNGEIVCLGSAGHLQRKFGNHYQVDLIAFKREDLGFISNWFTNKFPRAVTVEADGAHLRFWVPKSNVDSLAALFSFVHDHAGVPIQDAMVGDPSLEQIFLSIAHKAKHDPNAHFVQLFNAI